MRTIPILIATMALPLVVLGQAPDQQQAPSQGQPSEEKAPPKKKAHPVQEVVRPETNTTVHTAHAMKPETGAAGVNKTKTNSSTTTQTKVVNKAEFKSTHQEVFSLGQHPKEFFIQRYGANHFRLIGNTYFVFVDGCWVAVDVVGFTFVERTICEGEPDFVVVY